MSFLTATLYGPCLHSRKNAVTSELGSVILCRAKSGKILKIRKNTPKIRVLKFFGKVPKLRPEKKEKGPHLILVQKSGKILKTRGGGILQESVKIIKLGKIHEISEKKRSSLHFG